MKKLASILLAAILLAAIAAPALADEIILSHDKLNPNWQPFLEAWAEACNEAIGVTFTPVPYPATDVYAANMRTALPTDNAPQLFTWWSTYQGAELIEADLVMDITAQWDKFTDEYSEGLRNAFTFDGKCYGLPTNMSYWLVFYNTKVFEDNGLTPPATWDELIACCDKLVEAGVTPCSLTANDGWTSFIWFEELLMRSNPVAYEQLCAGEIKWDDPAVKQVFEIWADMIGKGYFTDGSLDFFSDIPKLFAEDRLGMIVAGSWYLSPQLDAPLAEGKVGTFLLPSMGDNGNQIIYEVGSIQVAKNNSNPEDTLAIVEYMLSKEGNGTFAVLQSCIPGNPAASSAHLDAIIADRAAQVQDEGYNLHNRYWENCPTPIMMAGVQAFDAFILNPDLATVDMLLAEVQAEADDYYADR